MLSICGATARAQSAQQLPAVVELFTSQGCNSCPPADALLGELAQRRDVIALAFHVDYWDSLGWRDRFALPESKERQRRYAEALKLSTVFTPQMIVDAHLSMLGSDRRGVLAALGSPRNGVPITVTVRRERLSVMLDPSQDPVSLDVTAYAYLAESSTRIGAGENARRTLKEFNIVRAVRHLEHTNGMQTEFQLPLASLPSDITGIAVLVQEVGQRSIVAAANVPLK